MNTLLPKKKNDGEEGHTSVADKIASDTQRLLDKLPDALQKIATLETTIVRLEQLVTDVLSVADNTMAMTLELRDTPVEPAEAILKRLQTAGDIDLQRVGQRWLLSSIYGGQYAVRLGAPSAFGVMETTAAAGLAYGYPGTDCTPITVALIQRSLGPVADGEVWYFETAFEVTASTGAVVWEGADYGWTKTPSRQTNDDHPVILASYDNDGLHQWQYGPIFVPIFKIYNYKDSGPWSKGPMYMLRGTWMDSDTSLLEQHVEDVEQMADDIDTAESEIDALQSAVSTLQSDMTTLQQSVADHWTAYP